MSTQLDFKFGGSKKFESLESKEEGAIYAVNEAFDETPGDEKRGSIYKGDKIVGTTVANKLVTTKEIKVTGVNVGNFSDGAIIEAGKSIEEILTSMLAKRLGVKATAPSTNLKVESGTASGTYEKGTIINPVFLAALSDGKYTGEGWDYTLAAGCKALSASLSGMMADAVVVTDGVSFRFSPDALELLSEVSVKANIAYAAASNVPVDNFNDEVTTGLIAAGSDDSSAIKFTPQLKWWVGSSNDKFADTNWNSSLVRGLGLFNNWVTTKSASVTFPKGAKQQVIAIPAGRSFTAKDGAGSDITGTFSSIAEVTVTCGGTHTEAYKVYVAPANAGLAADSKATITLV